ncbi:hypothetical protein FNYG_04088 [Fusarium nygamai]|uniref:Uncharacterized protein n=1 Tax=Gibberella nygamai TaxID=42673 RepID=A0A2K0WJC2_GIBNY|nr:hypothetical protein FNYG_04088 [Fusarium nygamai]
MEKPAAQKPLELRPIDCAYGASSSSRCLSCNIGGGDCDMVHELLTGNASDVHKLTQHVQMLLDFENDDPAGEEAMIMID